MSEDLLAKFQFGSMLGKGFYGEVYEATTELPGKVAVKKFMKEAGQSDADWSQKKQDLLEEGIRLKDAKHTHVVEVHQIFHNPGDDAVYLVMEHCANGSVETEFENGPMTLDRVRSVLHDVALGLHAIHARGMLHRDIKPANILLGANGRAKLGDFGWSTIDIQHGYAAGGGYLDHLAPEVHHSKITSIRTDIWALGMTAYRLLHGAELYNQLPPPRFIIPNGGFAASLPWLPHIPDGWRRFVRHLMNDDPNARCQDALAVVKSLNRLLVKPEWTCKYGTTQIVWETQKKERRIEVIWQRPSPRKNEWSAMSHPVGNGKVRRIGGSTSPIGRKTAEKELQKFFKEYLGKN